MIRHKCLYVKCRKSSLVIIFFFTSFNFGFIIPEASKRLRDKIKSADSYANTSLDMEDIETNTIILKNKLDSKNATVDGDIIQDMNMEISTELNLENAQKRLNDDDLFEHVAEKINVSQRSFVFIPASKFKIPFLNSLKRPQKIKDSAYDKTFISNVDTLETAPFGDFAVRYDGYTNRNSDPVIKGTFANENNNLKVSPLDNPFDITILENPIHLQREVDFMTNKVKSVNGNMKMQYNSLYDHLMNLDKEFKIVKTDKQEQIFKNGLSTIFDYNEHDNKPGDINKLTNAVFKHTGKLKTKEYTTKKPNENDENSDTGVNVNGAIVTGDRFDFVELIKPPLVRSDIKKQPMELNKKLNNSKKTSIPVESMPYQHDNLSSSINLKLHPFISKKIHMDDENYNGIHQQLTHLKTGPFWWHPSRNYLSTTSKNINTLQVEPLHNNAFEHEINLNNQSISNLHSDSKVFEQIYGQRSKIPIKSYENNISEPFGLLEFNNNSHNFNTKAYFKVKPPYQTTLVEQGRRDSIRKEHKHLNNAYKQSKAPTHDNVYSNYKHQSEYSINNLNYYPDKYKNNIMYNEINKKIAAKNHNSDESNVDVNQIEFDPDDNDEHDFQDSLLARKIQEIRELGKQFNEEYTSLETNTEKRINSRFFNNKSASHKQKKKKVRSRMTMFEPDCVHLNCETSYKDSKTNLHNEKCKCDYSSTTPKVEIGRKGLQPMFTNESTDFLFV